MGKQRTKPLKRKAEKLLQLFSERFTTDFEKNKKVLDELGFFSYSKRDRNIVAGIITRELEKAGQAS